MPVLMRWKQNNSTVIPGLTRDPGQKRLQLGQCHRTSKAYSFLDFGGEYPGMTLKKPAVPYVALCEVGSDKRCRLVLFKQRYCGHRHIAFMSDRKMHIKWWNRATAELLKVCVVACDDWQIPGLGFGNADQRQQLF